MLQVRRQFFKKSWRCTFSEDWGLSSLKSVFLIDKKCREEHLADNKWKALQRGLKRFLRTRTNTRCQKCCMCVLQLIAVFNCTQCQHTEEESICTPTTRASSVYSHFDQNQYTWCQHLFWYLFDIARNRGL